MKNYETLIVVTPLLSDEQLKEAIAKFKKVLTDNGAEIVAEDNWGLKKLAYPIQKKTTGFYHLTEFKASGELINKLEVEYKRDERIMRFLTIALDKHAVAYNDRKRNGQLAPLPKKVKVVEEAN
jgi:small subunit ribosomal protein S6